MSRKQDKISSFNNNVKIIIMIIINKNRYFYGIKNHFSYTTAIKMGPVIKKGKKNTRVKKTSLN